MFSYEVKVRKLTTPAGNLKAFCDLIIENALVIKDFKILEAKNGDLFAAAPTVISKKVDENGNQVWFPTVYFIDEKTAETDRKTPAEAEVLKAMIDQYLLINKTSTTAVADSTEGRPVAKTTAAKKTNPWAS